jgi:hypothetical protein
MVYIPGLVIRWLYQSYQFIKACKFCIETVTCLCKTFQIKTIPHKKAQPNGPGFKLKKTNQRVLLNLFAGGI